MEVIISLEIKIHNYSNLTSYNNDGRYIQFDHNIPQFIVKSHAQNDRNNKIYNL
jgi:hypothetical protein